MKNHLSFVRLAFLISVMMALAWLAGCAGPIALSGATATPEPTATPTAEPTPTTAAPTPEEPKQEMPKLLPPTGEVDGVPVGFTEDGHAYRGNPDASVVMIEYSEFQCPYCGRHQRETAPQIEEAYLKTGKVVLVFRDFPLEQIHPQAGKAAEAARCAGEQGAEQFWNMHDLLFERTEEWAGQEDAEDRFKSYASELGLNEESFNECLDSGRTREAIDADLQAGLAAGVRGTPTFFLNGYPLEGAQPFEAFQTTIDALVAGRTPPTPEPDIPYWATAEGMSPDPEKPGYTKAGDAFKGDPSAEVVIIEFADFQCPYCARHVSETAPKLEEEYVDTGLVRMIYKHFPLASIHPQAEPAAIAAECAGRQGKFWEMHDRLYATQEEWANQANAQEIFDRLAQEIGLDMDAYKACLDDPEIQNKIASDFRAGRSIQLRGTPSFIVLKGQQGQLIPGALPYEQFKQVIEAVLAAQ